MTAYSRGKLTKMSMQTQPHAKRVLIVTSSVGSGHNAVADAVSRRLTDAAPGVVVTVVDALVFVPKAVAAIYAGVFALGMSKFPGIYGLCFRASNRPHRPSRGKSERLRLCMERKCMRRFEAYILANRPDLIVCTHFLAPPVITRLARSKALGLRQIVVITDIEAHRFWYSEHVMQWFVPTDHTAEQLSQWGIPPQRVTVSGIPVHDKWRAPLAAEKILHEWRLPADRDIVLLSGGTDFTCGPVAKIARLIAGNGTGAYVIVLAGRNKKLLAKLARLPGAGRDILPLGFTDRVHELAEVASLAVTKAGGIFTAECLAKGKPMIFLKPVPGHESGNAKYLESKGAGIIARNTSEVVRTAHKLLADKGKLDLMSKAANQLHRSGAEKVVSAVLKALGQDHRQKP